MEDQNSTVSSINWPDSASAVGTANQVKDQDPEDDSNVLYQLALKKMAGKLYPDAIKYLSMAIEENSSRGQYYFTRSQCQYKQKEFAAAMADSNQAIVLQPDQGCNYYALGTALAGMAAGLPRSDSGTIGNFLWRADAAFKKSIELYSKEIGSNVYNLTSLLQKALDLMSEAAQGSGVNVKSMVEPVDLINNKASSTPCSSKSRSTNASETSENPPVEDLQIPETVKCLSQDSGPVGPTAAPIRDTYTNDLNGDEDLMIPRTLESVLSFDDDEKYEQTRSRSNSGRCSSSTNAAAATATAGENQGNGFFDYTLPVLSSRNYIWSTSPPPPPPSYAGIAKLPAVEPVPAAGEPHPSDFDYYENLEPIGNDYVDIDTKPEHERLLKRPTNIMGYHGLWIGSISTKCREETLSEHLSRFGKLTVVRLLSSRVSTNKQISAFVNFNNPKSPVDAICGLRGKYVKDLCVNRKSPLHLKLTPAENQRDFYQTKESIMERVAISKECYFWRNMERGCTRGNTCEFYHFEENRAIDNPPWMFCDDFKSNTNTSKTVKAY